MMNAKSPRVGPARFRRLPAILAVATCLLVPAIAIACSVPVFRFALEQWRPDAYQVFVYHDQDFSEEQSQWIQRLQRQGSATGDTNVQVQPVDVRGEMEPAEQHGLQEIGERPLPQMLVKLPKGIGGGEVLVGVAPFTEQEVETLVNSPARADLAQRLVDGQVVWVFLGSGDADKDDARLTALETELAGLQDTLELPAIEQADLKDLSVEPDALEIRFSALSVERDDPAEKWFVEMLLSSEPDLRDEELADEPMVFPVFGRGRALYALVGMGINADMIKEAAEFLTGPCQCTVKAENPGVDLLLPVRWDDYIVPTEPEEVALPLVGLGGYDPDPETGLPIVATTDPPAEDASEPRGESEPSEDAQASAEGDESTSAVMASMLAQGDSPGERTTLMLWLPWIVMILLGAIVAIASLGFFRSH